MMMFTLLDYNMEGVITSLVYDVRYGSGLGSGVKGLVMMFT